eukprot:3010130-Prorocentrum_lima.AAC.1
MLARATSTTVSGLSEVCPTIIRSPGARAPQVEEVGLRVGLLLVVLVGLGVGSGAGFNDGVGVAPTVGIDDGPDVGVDV